MTFDDTPFHLDSLHSNGARRYIRAMSTEQQAGAAVDSAAQDLAVELGVVIQSLMFRRRITQTQVARAMGISQGAISQKLHGRTAMTVADLYAIARVLDVDPGELLPRLDSNQQPSGYASALVSASLAQYGRPAALHLAGCVHTAAQWLDLGTERWYWRNLGDLAVAS